MLNRYMIILLLLFSIAYHIAAQILVHEEGKEINDVELPDMGFKIFKKSNDDERSVLGFLSDLLPPLAAVSFIILCLYYRNYYAFFSWLFALSMIYFLRATFFMSTILPDPSKRCTMENVLNGGCNDLIFSGHMAMIVISLLYIYNFFFPNFFFGFFSVKYILLAFVLILKNRSHYTVDLLVAMFMALLVYLFASKIPIAGFNEAKKVNL